MNWKENIWITNNSVRWHQNISSNNTNTTTSQSLMTCSFNWNVFILNTDSNVRLALVCSLPHHTHKNKTPPRHTNNNSCRETNRNVEKHFRGFICEHRKINVIVSKSHQAFDFSGSFVRRLESPPLKGLLRPLMASRSGLSSLQVTPD